MQSTNRRIVLVVTDSSSTMTADDWDRLFNSTAGTVDRRMPLPPQPEIMISGPPAREKYYWKPWHERFKRGSTNRKGGRR